MITAIEVSGAGAEVGLNLLVEVDSPGTLHLWASNTYCPVSIWVERDPDEFRVNRYARRNRIKRWACVYKGRVLKTALKHAATYLK